MENDKIFKITVYNTNGSNHYFTKNENVFCNFDHGNESTIRFITIDGVNVSLPPGQVIIEQSEVKH